MDSYHFFALFSIISVISPLCRSDKTVGFPEWLSEEYSNANCATDNVPTWLRGTFVRQQCGAFGGPKGAEKRSISHFYDCLGMLNAFKFENGRVTFSSRYFDTQAYRKWTPKRRDIDLSGLRVSWRTLFTPIDQTSFDSQSAASALQKSTTVEASPTGGVWSTDRSGCSLAAYSDAPETYDVNLRSGQMNEMGKETESDKSQSLSPDSFVLHHSAHASEDADGNLWGAALMARNKSANVYEIYRQIYKREAKTKKRTIFTEITSQTVELKNCRDVSPNSWALYPQIDDIGYVSEVAVTKNYLILIENPYVFNPCALMEQFKNSPQPFLATWFAWKGSSPLKLHFIGKTDKKLTTIPISPAHFVSRIVNAVENGPDGLGYVVIDVVTHPNAKVLTEYYNMKSLMSTSRPWPADASLKRYSIDPSTWSPVVTNNLLLKRTISGLSNIVSAEFATINEAVRGDSTYSYVYILIQPFSDGSAIWKVNVNNQSMIPWTPTESGIYPAGEVTFVSKSNQATTVKEDDGVLLVPAFNSNTKKGLILILDAGNMTQIGRVDAPALITFGTYSRFLPTCNHASTHFDKSGLMQFGILVLAFFGFVLRIM